MLPLERVERWKALTWSRPRTGSPLLAHSVWTGRVFHIDCSRVSTASIEFMFRAPRLSVRRPILGLVASALSVRSTVVMVLNRMVLVGKALFTAATIRSALASVIFAVG